METLIDVIKRRVSVRTYTEKALEGEKRGKIINLLSTNNTGPFGNAVRFALVDFSEIDKREIKTLGTYGFIKGANMFIVCAVKSGPGDMEDAGYCFERVILGATALGLGTCWLGGTFRRAGFSGRIDMKDDEVVPAVSPLGYAYRKRRWRESLLRRMVKADNRKPWEELFFDADLNTPFKVDAAGKYNDALECVRLGPSASNKQPWRIIRDKSVSVFRFYLQRNKGYGKAFEGIDLQRIDMGIAMCHFETAAREKGITGKWEVEKPAPVSGGMEYIVSWKEI